MVKLSKYFLFIICWLYTSTVQGYGYLLTMSKEDKTCQHMRQLFNGDLFGKGKLTLEDHKEFNWLKWDQPYFMIEQKSDLPPNYNDKLLSEDEYSQEYASYTKYLYKGAFFDIDNNGIDEFISFERRGGHTYEHRAYDKIYIYKPDAYNKLSGSKTNQTYNPAIGYLGQLTNNYTLKAYPVKRTVLYKTGAISHRWPSLSDSFIRPFLFDKTYYIALFSNVDTHISDPLRAYNQSIDEKNAVAVVKFTPSYEAEKIKEQFELLRTGQPSNETQEICYFVKTQVIKQGQK